MISGMDLPSEGMNAKVNRECQVSFFARTAMTHSTIKVLFIVYFVLALKSESESESESEPELESISPTTAPHAWAQLIIRKIDRLVHVAFLLRIT